jgi:predicted DNA-binding transcriptional regulator YafY
MAKKLAFERYYWFDGQIRANRHPNAKKLADVYGISQKQAQRDIEFMRDRLNPPLHFNYGFNGYEYAEAGYQLPPFWLNQEEVLALCIASRLAAAVPDKRLKSFLHEFLGKFLTLRSVSRAPGIKSMEEKISIKNIGYYKVEEAIFHQTVGTLFEDVAMIITYHTPYTGEVSERLIQPLHLLCYMGNWHLIAYCTMRDELRDFTLSRITKIERGTTKINLPADLPSIKEYMRQTFGVITGPCSIEVVLKFNAAVSARISEQVWHDNQQILTSEDGSLQLTFPVSGFEEVAREILKYGADVEVLEPDELREIVREEIKKMGKIYR